MTALVCCDRVTKYYGPHPALREVTWALAEGELAGLIGSSGAGKTTLLRILAGLERCSSGEVTFPSADWGRGGRGTWVGMVFQDHGLWPHLTARQHVECVLPRDLGRQRKPRLERLLADVQLPPECWSRRPAELSGGEAQRLALARALAPGPRLLLLDEPLAQVDVPLRAELLALIRQLCAQRRLTVLYVTHSWLEALDLCNRLVVLVAGRLVQEGPVADVFACPVCADVARLTGPVVEIPVTLIEAGRVHAPAGTQGVRDGGLVLVRPQQIHFTSPSGPNCWQVRQTRPYSHGWQVVLRSESSELTVQTTEFAAPHATVAVALVSRPTTTDDRPRPPDN